MQSNEDKKQQLVERLLRERGVAPRAQPAVMRPRTGWVTLEIDGQPVEAHPFPASHAQELMWLNEQLAEGAFYHLPFEFVLLGALDLGAMEQAVRSLVERHEVLRTVFRMEDARLTPHVLRAQAASLEVDDLSNLDAATKTSNVAAGCSSFTARSFDLANGLTFRAKVFRLTPTEHVLLLVAHHIVTDGTGGAVIARDLAALYEAHVKHSAPALSPVTLHYGDFALWERERLTEARIEEHLAFFRAQLTDASRRVDLPFDGSSTSEVEADQVEITLPRVAARRRPRSRSRDVRGGRLRGSVRRLQRCRV